MPEIPIDDFDEEQSTQETSTNFDRSKTNKKKKKLHDRDVYQLVAKYPSAKEKSSGGGSNRRWVEGVTMVFAQEKIDGSQLSVKRMYKDEMELEEKNSSCGREDDDEEEGDSENVVETPSSLPEFVKDTDRETQLVFRSKRGPIGCDTFFGDAVRSVSTLADLLRPNWTYRGETVTRLRHTRILYGRIPKHSFVLFEIQNEKGHYLPPNLIQEEAERIGFEYSQILYQGILDFKKLKEVANNSKSQLGGFAMIEGIVTKMYKNGKMLSFKLVAKQYKETKTKKIMKINEFSELDKKLKVIAKGVCTRSRWEKAIFRFLENGGEKKDSDLGGKISLEIKNDIMKEETETIIRLLKENDIEYTDTILNVILEHAVDGAKDWAKDFVKNLDNV